MSVTNGQPASETVFNSSFVSRTSNSNTTGKLDLQNADSASGSAILNLQRQLNSLCSALGIPVNQLKDYTPAWTTNAIGSPTDTTKERIESIITFTTGITSSITNSVTKVSVPYSSLAAAALTNDISVFSLPAKTAIAGIILKHETAFSGGSITSYELDLGIVGELDRWVIGYDVFQAVGSTVLLNVAVTEAFDFSSATDIRLKATSVGDNLDQATQGTVDIYFMTVTLP